jgi:hypothetical protein
LNIINKRYQESQPVTTPWSKRDTNWLIWAFLIVFVGFLSLYSKFKSGVYVQDDPYVIEYFKFSNTPLPEKIFSSDGNRWRPVSNICYWLLSSFISASYFRWFMISSILLSLLIICITYQFLRIKRDFVLATILIILIATSRFNQGILLNATFLCETICIFFLIPIILNFRKNWYSSKFSNLPSTIAYISIIILAHERYVGLGLFFLTYCVIHPKFSIRERVKLCVILITPIVALFIVKHFFLHIPLFVGTGTALGVGFTLLSALQFLMLLIFGLFGVNIGLEYLHGYIFQNQTPLIQFSSILLMFITLILFFRRVKASRDKFLGGQMHCYYRKMLVLLSLFASLAIPIVSTIRIESRWFFPIYVLFLFYLFSESEISETVQTKRLIQKKAKPLFVLKCFLGLNLALNLIYIQKVDLLYFVGTQNLAKIQIESLGSSLSEPNGSKIPIYLLDKDNQIDFNSLKAVLGINLKLDTNRLRRVEELSEIKGLTLNDLVFEYDTTKSNGSFRRIDLANEKYSISGDWYADSWAGKRVNISASSALCSQLHIKILPSQWENSVKVLNSGKSYRIATEPIDLYFPTVGFSETVSLIFSETFIPYEQEINDDRRKLSNRVVVTCDE